MKKILDACCGSRMCWFDKDNPDTVFMDWRSGPMSSGTSARCRFPIIRSISSCSILRI